MSTGKAFVQTDRYPKPIEEMDLSPAALVRFLSKALLRDESNYVSGACTVGEMGLRPRREFAKRVVRGL